ncbi:DUF2986 domain-containing protein [Thiomicrospira microaerophila]|uniref:DUF2986 domain-containing protein n=1 Tax=Thiomicrospira microaerophila TaxID=406020 RepID=UPI00200F7673|nr:DUF2986 domain-containing protein [Thiomicrospira microaerophila]
MNKMVEGLMNRKKKIYQKIKKKLLQQKAKKQPVKKPAYISKADRARLALEGKSEQAQATEESK